MILFQDSGETVTFSPGSFTRNPSWPEKLLVLYLLAILIFLLVRVIQLIWCLRSLRKREPVAQDGWDKVWCLGKLRSRSLMRLAFLTLLVCVLEISLTVTDGLWAIGTQKGAHSWWLLVEVAEDLGPFNAGMAICIVLYAFGFFFESRLERRRLAISTAQVPSRTLTD